jgi:hypothetical protein
MPVRSLSDSDLMLQYGTLQSQTRIDIVPRHAALITAHIKPQTQTGQPLASVAFGPGA